VHAADLSGVHVVLDAGHGGKDTGAVSRDKKVWEAPYAYDIMCRIKENLERHTNAVVWTTIRDESRGYTVLPEDRLPLDRDQVLLTHPPFKLSDYSDGQRNVPVHLRWYLTNHIVRERAKQGVPASRVVFLSVHADSLHPSVRGAMAYVPSRHLRPSSYSIKTGSITRYREHKAGPTVQLSSRFMARAEASSLRLAESLMTAVRGNGLAVHPYRPVRDRVLRGKRSWVPAVLRYSLAQNAVLLECCNLANAEDLKLLQDRSWRERFARSVVAGLASAYGTD
jgi:N-acetylmuramoyl-L-alanine amidase